MLRIIAERKELLRKVPRGSIDRFMEMDKEGAFEDSPGVAVGATVEKPAADSAEQATGRQ